MIPLRRRLSGVAKEPAPIALLMNKGHDALAVRLVERSSEN